MSSTHRTQLILEPSAPGWERGDRWWDNQIESLAQGLASERLDVDYVPASNDPDDGFGHKSSNFSRKGVALALKIGVGSLEAVVSTLKSWLEADEPCKMIRLRVPSGDHSIVLEASGDDLDLRKMRDTLHGLLLTPSQASTRTDIPLVFLGANPTLSPHLGLNLEFQRIRAALERSPQHRRFVLHPYWHVRPRELATRLIDHAPKLVHFSGHGTQEGELVFESSERGAKPAAPELVAELFALVPSVRCVVLSACFSAEQAAAIARHVDWVVGMGGAVPDALSLEFSAGFYHALGHGYAVRRSFELARVQARLAQLPDSDCPTLFERPGADHEMSVLV